MPKPDLVYKLTDQNDQTHGRCQWGENITHKTTGTPEYLCSSGWLHFYRDRNLAILLNPIQANITTPHLWRAKASGLILEDHGLKYGCTSLTTLRRVPLPRITSAIRIRFAIYCTQSLPPKLPSTWNRWARDWLSGKDRTQPAARAAAGAARAARAAAGAARAARAAAGAARAARAAAWAAAWAARAAEAAAEAAGALKLPAIAALAIKDERRYQKTQ